MERFIRIMKERLFNMARTLINTQPDTPEAIERTREIDLFVGGLLNFGIAEAELRDIISSGQDFTEDRPPPPFPTRRYIMRQVQVEERPRVRYNPDDLPFKIPRPLEGDEIISDNLNLEQYMEKLKCPICYVNIKDVALNCGHMLCKTCARILYIDRGMRQCHECRVVVTDINKVFLSKYLKYKTKYFQLMKSIN
jgi:hypothetical protein